MSKFFEKLIGWIIQAGTILAGIGLVIIAAVEWLVQLVMDLTFWAASEIAAMQGPNFEFNLADHADTLALVNHFFPLAEFWAMLLLTVPYMLFIVALRFVKQFIPTMSN